jgi:hypothetical protein
VVYKGESKFNLFGGKGQNKQVKVKIGIPSLLDLIFILFFFLFFFFLLLIFVEVKPFTLEFTDRDFFKVILPIPDDPFDDPNYRSKWAKDLLDDLRKEKALRTQAGEKSTYV